MNPQYIFINAFGDTYYFSDKEMSIRHRDDGPAVEYADGEKVWYRNGEVHREDGPAVILTFGTKKWFHKGVLHRTDGPAVEWDDGSKTWYLNGERLDEAQFKVRKSPCNGKKVTIDGVEYTLKA